MSYSKYSEVVMARTKSSIAFRMSKLPLKNRSLSFLLISSRWDLPWQFCVNITSACEMQFRGSTSGTVYMTSVESVLEPKKAECLGKGWKWKSNRNHLPAAATRNQNVVYSSVLQPLSILLTRFGHSHFYYYFLQFWGAWVKASI